MAGAFVIKGNYNKVGPLQSRRVAVGPPWMKLYKRREDGREMGGRAKEGLTQFARKTN